MAEMPAPTQEHPLTRDLEHFLQLMHEGTSGPHLYASLLGLRSYDLPHLLRSVQQGLPYSVLDHFRRNTGASWDQLAHVLAIPQRTLTRRRQQGRFLPEESDRILRAARIYAKAIEVFEGDVEGGWQWLSRPQTGLGGGVPIDLARTDLGAREVENLLEALEHGVFS